MEDTPQPLHVVGVAGESSNDAVWLSRRIGELLSELQPTTWQGDDPGTAMKWQELGRRTLDPAAGREPAAGDVILASIECETDAWLREPLRRILVFMQATSPSWCLERLRRIAADGARSVTLVFTSRAMASRFGAADYVVPPPIDLGEFIAASHGDRAPSSQLRVATVGQDSRRVIIAPDVGLLHAVAERAGELRLFDPGPLRYNLGSLREVRCFSRREIDIGTMLREADVYWHRALPWWAEDSGRALFGAMAQGIPTLCHRESSHAEYVDDGVDGILYADGSSALAAIDVLRADRTRLHAMGEAARAKAMRLFEPRALARAYASVVERWRALP
jgi:glycosyltransferase involved in cell wall biosynthesis